MRTLIPPALTAPAQPRTRAARMLGFALTPRALTLLLAGLLLAIPAFFHPPAIWIMFAWDAAVLTLTLLEALSLPLPRLLTVTRRFLDSPRLGELTRVNSSSPKPPAPSLKSSSPTPRPHAPPHAIPSARSRLPPRPHPRHPRNLPRPARRLHPRPRLSPLPHPTPSRRALGRRTPHPAHTRLSRPHPG